MSHSARRILAATLKTALIGSASVVTLAVALAPTATRAQQSLPSIDVGASAPRETAKPRPSASDARPAHPSPAAPAPVAAAPEKPKPFSRTLPENIPAVVSSATRDEIFKTVNVTTTAEVFKYQPSILIRERYIGDRNAIVSTRTTGTIESAKTLVYADDILLSNLLGNSFNFPPRWGLVSPEEIERIDTIYGPFSALYTGNSIGGVLTVTTRMPENFEVHASGTAALQTFNLYGNNERDLAGDMNLLVGNRVNDFSYWIGYDRLDAQGQSQTFQGGPITTAGKGVVPTPVTGGYVDLDQNSATRLITGSAGQDHSQQHLVKGKFAYDLAPGVRAAYTVGLWDLNSDTFVSTYLRDQNGQPVYNTSSGLVSIAGIGVFPLSGLNPVHAHSTHLMQGLSLKSDTHGVFDFDIAATSYNYLRDYSETAASYARLSTGTNTDQTDTYWRTLDARGIWRPEFDAFGKHEVSFGGNAWEYSLASLGANTPLYTNTYYTSLSAVNYGKTDLSGLYIQDAWKFLPDWKLTAGARGDFWHAFGGVVNASSATRPNLPPDSFKQSFSPKGSLEYQVTPDFTLRGSVGRAYRFPTVNELFQNISTANGDVISNPYLQPEISTSYDLTGEYSWANAFGGYVGLARPRVSLFLDDRWNAIISQTDNVSGKLTTQNTNLDRARFRGVEGVIEMHDVIWKGLNFNGSATFTDSKTLRDHQTPLAEGKQYPRVPRIRLRMVGSYSPTDDMSFAIGMRYASGAFTQLINTDFNHNNYGSVDSEYLVFDAKVNYKFDKNWTASVGIDNIGRWKYYVNPNPYPQRTFFFSLKYDLGGPERKASDDVKLN